MVTFISNKCDFILDVIFQITGIFICPLHHQEGFPATHLGLREKPEYHHQGCEAAAFFGSL